MLGSLAKRLRLLGFDVLYDPSLDDNAVLRISLEQNRIILTRDAGLAARPLASNHVLISSDHVDGQARQVLDSGHLQDAEPLSRCSDCNAELVLLGRNDARDRVPGHVHATVSIFFHCSQCGRVYWRGSHVKNWEGRQRMGRSEE